MSEEKKDEVLVDVNPAMGEDEIRHYIEQHPGETENQAWLRYYSTEPDRYQELRKKYPHYGRKLVIGGDDEPEAPFPAERSQLTEEEKKFVFKYDDPMYNPPEHPEKATLSFPLQVFASDIDKRGIAGYDARRERQAKNARLRLQTEPDSFVLMTGSYANCQAKSIVGILWVYLVHKFVTRWKSKTE